MWPVKASPKKLLVPLSADLVEDIIAHGNEKRTPPGNPREVECVGDSRETQRRAPSTFTQPIPLEIRRRTEGLAEGPIVVPRPISMTILSKPKRKLQKKTPMVIKQNKEVKDSMVELWVRDPTVKKLADRVRLSFASNNGKPVKLTPSMVLTKLEARLDTLANGMMALQKWVPILINQNRKLIKGKPATLNASPSPVSLSIKSSSDPGQVETSSDDSTASELDLRGDQLKTKRNTTRELYYDMQMHLVNMLVVPKSHTSLFLNQRKDLMRQLGGGHGHWRHQYTEEDWKRDREAAAFLKGDSSGDLATRRLKNVRRQ
ncbi:uncharacterized protein LOC119547450 [Drosophila subpulchrella]|uniref:uncharacterized protein LOC119547450 n=1 Tax=Drosophila subpulchrella TaxID=1486046 RepID=UPI0018A18FB0|nr:uncharacterized protein LOC119547450 [Drosophila subpulchrella]